MYKVRYTIAFISISIVMLGLVPGISFGQCSIHNMAAADSVFGSSVHQVMVDISTSAQSSGNLSGAMISAAITTIKDSPGSSSRVQNVSQTIQRNEGLTLEEKRASRMCGGCVPGINPNTLAAEEVKKLFQIE